MEKKSSNKSLRKADGVKNDEFYTRYDDVQAELNFYKDQLKESFSAKKVILPSSHTFFCHEIKLRQTNLIQFSS